MQDTEEDVSTILNLESIWQNTVKETWISFDSALCLNLKTHQKCSTTAFTACSCHRNDSGGKHKAILWQQLRISQQVRKWETLPLVLLRKQFGTPQTTHCFLRKYLGKQKETSTRHFCNGNNDEKRSERIIALHVYWLVYYSMYDYWIRQKFHLLSL